MIEAMKQALEVLERSVATCFDQYAHEQVMSQPDHFINQSITSLRQAIAEAEKQEPVAWMNAITKEIYWRNQINGDVPNVPLYTHQQPKREQDGNCQHCGGKGCVACDARKQEPVLWVMPDGKTVDKWGLQFYGGQTGKPLYTHPQPKREWVGLTDEEIKLFWSQSLADTEGETYLPLTEFASAIEAKLKEKNT